MTAYLINDHDLALFTPVGNSGSMDYVVTDKTLPNGSTKSVDIPIYPGNSFDYGEDICSYHYDDWKADILLLMVDIFALKDPSTNPPGILGHSRKGKFKTVLIAPVDYLEPFPPGLPDYFNSCYRIVPWCYDAYNKLQRAGVKNVLDPIPCGLDTKLWSPLDRSKFPETMSTMGFSDKNYNILMVGANQGTYRKAWAESFSGISLFKKAHPEANVRIYLHSQSVGGSQDWNFQELARFYGLVDNITAMDTYQFSLGKFVEEMLVRMYACCDVVINAGAEGFGYSTLQAQAMGKPVIGLNSCATPELVRYGILVEPRFQLQTPSLLIAPFPAPVDIAEGLEILFVNEQDKFADQRKETIQWVKETFDWNIIMAKWKTVLEGVEGDLRRDCQLRAEFPPKPSSWCLERVKKTVILK